MNGAFWNWQDLTAWGLVATAVAYLAWRAAIQFRSKSGRCQTGCSHCPTRSTDHASLGDPTVPREALAASARRLQAESGGADRPD